MKGRALITGLTGQDGSYLAELLLSKGYEVHGLVQRAAPETPEERLWRIRHLLPELHLHEASLESYAGLCKLFQEVQPHECYHLAAQSHVSYSFDDEFSTMRTNVQGTHELLAALKQVYPECKFCFAGSSQVFGRVDSNLQSETTPFHPQSMYAISKASGFYLTQYYRETYSLFACNAILFNHESPRRGLEFVTRKITSHVAKIKLGLGKELKLGNLDAKRDWGHAREYVEAMWRMLQHPQADDYVVATGEAHSVREFCEVAFAHLGLDYRDWVKVDSLFLRPSDVDLLVGDCTKIRKVLGWQHKTTWAELAIEMVESDIEQLQRVQQATTVDRSVTSGIVH